MKIILLILCVSISTAISQLLLKRGARDLEFSKIDSSLLISAASSPYIICSIFLQIFSFVLWLAVLSKANLGYAIGFSGAFLYLLVPFFSWYIYHERLGASQWIGLLLITAGIVCMANK